MKWLKDYRMILVAVVSAIVLGGRAKADFIFGEPTVLDATINSGGHIWFDCISNDGLELYTERPGSGNTMGDWDFFVSTRATTNDLWSAPVKLGPPVNTSSVEGFACLSSDDLKLYFASTRPGGYGRYDLWVSTRPTRFDSWGPPENLGPTINTSDSDNTPWITPDGLELYFSSGRPGGYGNYDIWVAKRPAIEDNWGIPENLGPVVNSGAFDSSPCLSPGGLILFFSDYPDQSLLVRPGGLGQTDMWMSRRKSITDPWGPPVNLGSGLNSSRRDCQPRLSPDGDCLYFSSMRSGGPSGGYNIWQAPILPIVDFNGDEIVDSADMCIMIDHWGTDYSACDIGPMPWGDGVVNIEDLKVLAEHLFQEAYDPTLVVYWPLDEAEGMVIDDAVGENQAFAVGDPVWQPDGGQVGGALLFDGVDDFISAPAVLNPADGPFSVFVWINGGAPGQVLVAQETVSDWLSLDAEGKLMTDLKCVGRSAGPLLSEAVIDDGQWHRVGLAWDGSNRTLIVDDVVVAEDVQALESSDRDLYIGVGKDFSPDTFFSGLIDDVRIYNRAVSP